MRIRHIVTGDGILSIEAGTAPPRIAAIDHVEQLRCEYYTDEPVSPTQIDTANFQFPVGEAVRIHTSELVIPTVVSVVVRDAGGKMHSKIEHLESETLPDGQYSLDLSTQIKTYVEVDGPVEITVDLCEIRIDFPESTAVNLGFRSRHRQPAGTVTTTDSPADLMQVVSTFGSALKSTSPERAFPTLRGHPPRVRLGDELDIPGGLQPPETGITLRVPPSHEYIYPVAPLAYYLGALVVPGDPPRLTTDDGFTHELDSQGDYEEAVEATLKQIFLCDCLARTEGFYKIDLHERQELADELSWDWQALYDQALAERLETYLSVPYSMIAPHVPQWRLLAHVEPVAARVEQLPFIVDDLAIVRTKRPHQSFAMDEPSSSHTTNAAGDVLTRGGSTTTRSTTETNEAPDQFVKFEPSTALEQAWLGHGIPIGASKLTGEAFENRLAREVSPGDISISIVVNDDEMEEERGLVSEAYGDREDLPFDITIDRNLTTAELRSQLTNECHFLHYIGHIDADGFECADGTLDASTIDDIDVDAFFLNACNSYAQGHHLIEAGAIAGIVTLTDIPNPGAIDMGETIARLLNAGFPLRAALTIAAEESILGGQYIVVGDGGMTVTQSPSGTPNMLEIRAAADDFEVTIRTFASDTFGMGSIYQPYIGENIDYFLNSGTIGPFVVSTDSLQEFLDLQDVPIRIGDSELTWSSAVTVDDIENLLESN